ncbi:uncharacterized protein HD556DRAFT_1265584 [Suillus plorans]|uniref:Uncharacterized protein n=1 Tax=Suillus plorans TaxID=116603 RepID=A0A9P7DQB5_9AGAM|nr:uncharacterized protein HD556DRAFT_1265584 [Suillus plorans]KAG1800431.1 hypothetical protein HD556DRAFT_1265584 [Suillus plorans]
MILSSLLSILRRRSSRIMRYPRVITASSRHVDEDKELSNFRAAYPIARGCRQLTCLMEFGALPASGLTQVNL